MKKTTATTATPPKGGFGGTRLIPDKGQVAMRLYSQGLGDCFLFAFSRESASKESAELHDKPCYMVIDCGVGRSTPKGSKRTERIVQDIYDATNGVVDILALTHQHYDHLSSFLRNANDWRQLIQVGAIYLPWTEKKGDTDADSLNDVLRKINKAAAKAVKAAAANNTLDDNPELKAEADFLGLSFDKKDGDGDKDKGEGVGELETAFLNALALCPDPDKIKYFEPGDVFRLPGTEFHGYVLGPPRPNVKHEGKACVNLLADEAQMYHYKDVKMNADGETGGKTGFRVHSLGDDQGFAAFSSAFMLGDSPLDVSNRADDERFCPFDGSIRLDWDAALTSDFFANSYGGKDENNAPTRGANGSWRRIDDDWLLGASSLALRAGEFTNNVSLVLAFDVPDSQKMLLFPGDAQVGNWLSWHQIPKWRFFGDAAPKNPPAPDDKNTLMENLLGRVAFYKVGHHGSHNATIKQKGLELMTRDDLTAFIPVSVAVAQDYMGYCPMPFYPVVRRLQEKTQGRVFLSNGRAVRPLPNGKTEKEMPDAELRHAANIKLSSDDDPTLVLPGIDGKDGKAGEEKGPLYLQLTVKPQGVKEPKE